MNAAFEALMCMGEEGQHILAMHYKHKTLFLKLDTTELYHHPMNMVKAVELTNTMQQHPHMCRRHESRMYSIPSTRSSTTTCTQQEVSLQRQKAQHSAASMSTCEEGHDVNHMKHNYMWNKTAAAVVAIRKQHEGTTPNRKTHPENPQGISKPKRLVFHQYKIKCERVS